MPRYSRGQTGLLALLAVVGPAQAATGLPPFRVDPALLRAPPSPPAAARNTGPTTVPPEAAPVRPLATTPAQPATAAAPEKEPVYLTADHIVGTTSVETVAEGNVELKRGERALEADRLVYREPLDEVEATGNVKLTSPGESIAGPHVKLKLDESVGTFDTPVYSIHRLKTLDPAAKAHGTAARLDFAGKDKYELADATYSTCPANGDPDWFARVSDLSLDYTVGEGTARGTTVVFKGVPILYSPWLSFTLDNRRKTGLLAPTVGSTSKGGIELTAPFYWNIAPEMDATVAPRFMAKRGTQWNGQYRYLGESYTGQVAGEYLYNDEITHTNRNALTILHRQDFGYGLSGSLNLNKVSDDTYFSDLSTRLSNISQTNLLREGRLEYNGSDWWSARLMAQRFQTLQDPSLPPVAIPYDRLPQFLMTANRPDMPGGWEVLFRGEYADFQNPTGTAVEARRSTAYPQLAYPVRTAAYYVTPKAGFHSTRYEFDNQPAAGTALPERLTRNVPIFSIDAGTAFERPVLLSGQDLTQTLEPRAYYLRVPYRNQSVLENRDRNGQVISFDTAIADFNFSQIFSENSYAGGDRIADANQLTLAATSRLIDTSTGGELLRGAIGQRYYFTDPQVRLNGKLPHTGHTADLLAALAGNINREMSFDSGIQYNYRDQEMQRFNVRTRYQPGLGRVLNAGYRYTRGLLRQVDAAAQWPLFGGWHAVGRYNYSFRDARAIETIAGLEYDGGCWASRFVVQRLGTAIGQVNNSIFVQLELNGFSDIGSNPLDLLKRSIPGYGQITNTPADPVFAE